MNYTNEQIEKAINALPEQIVEMLFLPETDRSVQKIGIEKGLLIDQLKSLNEVVNLAITGLIPEQEIASFLTKEINITEAQAKELADKVFIEIIKPIHNLKEKIEAEESKKREQREQEDREIALLEREIEEIENAIEVHREDLSGEEIPALEDEEMVVAEETQQEQEDVPQVVIPQTITPQKPRTRMPDVAPDNLPIKENLEEQPLIPPILSKQDQNIQEAESSEPEHPFEEKMKRVLTPGRQSMNDFVLDTKISHDPYREPIE